MIFDHKIRVLHNPEFVLLNSIILCPVIFYDTLLMVTGTKLKEDTTPLPPILASSLLPEFADTVSSEDVPLVDGW